jgi:hypothetical protein
MKIVYISLLTATLLGLAFFPGVFPFEAGGFISSCFAVALLAWTIAQYRRKVCPLTITRPIRLPARLNRHDAQTSPKFTRLAA